MKNNLRIVLVLTAVSLICGFILSLVCYSAKEKIEENEKKYIRDAILNITDNFRKVKERAIEDKIIYELFDERDNFGGYAYLYQGQGYQGKIKILFGINKDLDKLLGIEIIDSMETPGLGAWIKEDFFKQQFEKLDVSGDIECVKAKPKRDNEIEAITSATVSSKAVVSILNQGINELKDILTVTKENDK